MHLLSSLIILTAMPFLMPKIIILDYVLDFLELGPWCFNLPAAAPSMMR